MTTISLAEIQSNFADYLGRVQAGETFVVTSNGRAVAEIKALESQTPAARPHGLAAGEFTVPDDFDAPLPDDILRDFSGL